MVEVDSFFNVRLTGRQGALAPDGHNTPKTFTLAEPGFPLAPLRIVAAGHILHQSLAFCQARPACSCENVPPRQASIVG